MLYLLARTDGFQVKGASKVGKGVVRERGAKQVSATQGRYPGIEATHGTVARCAMETSVARASAQLIVTRSQI